MFMSLAVCGEGLRGFRVDFVTMISGALDVTEDAGAEALLQDVCQLTEMFRTYY